jgi:hypothetical protein
MPGGSRRHSGRSGSVWQIRPRTGKGPHHDNRPLLIRQAGQHRGEPPRQPDAHINMVNKLSIRRHDPVQTLTLWRDNLDEMAHCHARIVPGGLTIASPESLRSEKPQRQQEPQRKEMRPDQPHGEDRDRHPGEQSLTANVAERMDVPYAVLSMRWVAATRQGQWVRYELTVDSDEDKPNSGHVVFKRARAG